MAEQGGYRLPSKPAMQSGPGSLSQRTDGGPASKQAARYIAGGNYGEGQEMMDIQTSAPMAATPETAKPTSASQIQEAVPQTVIPFNAPTQYPNEPGEATAVVPQNAPDADENFRASIAMYMPALAFISDLPTTSQETRDIIRQLRQAL
jgi:hypothetical protein